MTILIHLSDMHFEKSIDDLDLHIEKLVATLNSHKPFDKIVLIMSGDITRAGKVMEYKAAQYFISTLKKRILSNFTCLQDEKCLEILSVPGNHDMLHPKVGYLTHEDLENIYRCNEYERDKINEIDKLSNYFSFAQRHKCFCKESVCDRRDININGKVVSFFLINSAIFSLKREEDKGFHYIDKQ